MDVYGRETDPSAATEFLKSDFATQFLGIAFSSSTFFFGERSSLLLTKFRRNFVSRRLSSSLSVLFFHIESEYYRKMLHFLLVSFFPRKEKKSVSI